MAAPQNLVLQFWDGSAWNDQLTLSGPQTKITRGSDGESGTRPAKIEIALNNDDDRYRISNPSSPLYGLAGRNTRCRVRVDGVTRTQAEASSWKPAKTPEHSPGVRGLAWCDLTAEGLLRRVGQWTTPLRSSVFRAISQYTTLLGYWPMEDGKDSTQLTNAVRNGRPGSVGNMNLAGADGPGGSDQLVEISTGGAMSGVFPSTASATAGWQISFTTKLTAIPAAIGFYPLLQWFTNNGNMWTFDVDDNEYRVTVRTSDGTILKVITAGFGAGAEPNQWIIFRVKVSQVGGNVQIEPAWYPEGGSALYGVTDTYAAASMGRLTKWRVSQNPHNLGAGMGHVFAVTGVADNLQSYGIVRGFDGFPGETAGARFQRLCQEEGIAYYVNGVVADTAPMGPQKPATFKQHLDQIIATENAMIFDEWLDVALRMVCRGFRYNQAVALALSYPSDIAPTLEEVTDDLETSNVVTVSNAAGGEYTAALDTGRMSTLPPPAGVGEAKSTYNVSVANGAQLPDIATWYLAKGTLERSRYPKVKVDLLANPGLAAAAAGVDISERITITGLEAEVVDLLVIGLVETVGHTTRTIEFTCVPADVEHHIGVYDATSSRYDSATTKLAAGTTTTATAMSLTTTERADCWSTTETPYACMVAGERVTVTAMTAPAGTGPYTQTATVTRSVNGIVKTHLSGDQFQLADPVRFGL